LFFSLSPRHLHLPSFPTRRSSDLPWHGLSSINSFRCKSSPTRFICFTTFVTYPPHIWTNIRKDHSHRLVLAHNWPSFFMPLIIRDRKSTRLNSSHVSISYAVFCLK